ncbi:MAG: ferritin-like domain-containing protein [Bacteroidota bacterium]
MNFQNWITYFKSNRENFSHISWNINDKLTFQEKSIIAKSVQQFQRGEGSEGLNWIKSAERYFSKMEDKSYVEALKLFIKEEQRHSEVLGKMMNANLIPKIEAHWMDNLFRRVRKYTNLEYEITILITAEFIATVYYDALAKAVKSPLVKDLCAQILKDEAQHLAFQSEALRFIKQRQSLLGRIFNRAFHHALVPITIALVWAEHRQVLKAGGYDFKTYAKQIWHVYRTTIPITAGEELAQSMTEKKLSTSTASQ